MALEIERRFFVEKLDWDILQGVTPLHIVQGYLRVSVPSQSFRVRIINGTKAVITIKSGMGLVREENEKEISLGMGQVLLGISDCCVTKLRYTLDGWEVDVFQDALADIVVAEKEMETPDEHVVLPPWIPEAKEVTDLFTSFDLARVARNLQNHGRINPLSLKELFINVARLKSP